MCILLFCLCIKLLWAFDRSCFVLGRTYQMKKKKMKLKWDGKIEERAIRLRWSINESSRKENCREVDFSFQNKTNLMHLCNESEHRPPQIKELSLPSIRRTKFTRILKYYVHFWHSIFYPF